ncbi:MAG: CpsD/CapB family tyrosine-protein kinase [Deltaproteobacteria bacterium]|nr:CpsD/CapB family tyrosine-protein kinase [Deltaproteobacteria bacterium]
MGKFSDALEKSRASAARTDQTKRSSQQASLSARAIDELRLDTKPKVEPQEQAVAFSGKVDPRLVCFTEPASPAAESFKLLRAKIFTNTRQQEIRTLIVTSPQPFDGKSLVAANLAMTIARGINEHVLLIDADMRRPSLHKIFGLQVSQGLFEYLRQGTSIEPYLTKTPVAKLVLVPAGMNPQDPSELLSSDKMRTLLQELRDRYSDRYIIIDAPPASFAAESKFLVHMSDATLLVVRSGKTRLQATKEAIKNLVEEKILGVVFNADPAHAKTYQDYYHYYSK